MRTTLTPALALVPLADAVTIVGGVLTAVLAFVAGLLALALRKGPQIVGLLVQVRDALHANTHTTAANTDAARQDRQANEQVAVRLSRSVDPGKVAAALDEGNRAAAPLVAVGLVGLLLAAAAGGCAGVPFLGGGGTQPPTPPDPIQVEQQRLDAIEASATFALNLLSDLRDADRIDQQTVDLAKPAADAVLAAVAQARADLARKDLTAEQAQFRAVQAAADKLRPLVVKLLAKPKPKTDPKPAVAKKPPPKKPPAKPKPPPAEPAPAPAPDPVEEGPPPEQLQPARREPVGWYVRG